MSQGRRIEDIQALHNFKIVNLRYLSLLKKRKQALEYE